MSPAAGWVLPQTALRQAVGAQLGRTQRWVEPDEVPTVKELFDRYGSTAAIAEAAGYGTAANPRTVNGLSRESFMRSLRRYRQGTRAPIAERRRLFGRLVRKARRRQATPHTVEEFAALMREHGFTFHGVALVQISADLVQKTWPAPGWWVSPALVDETGLDALVAGRHWREAVMPLSRAMGAAYGVPGMVLVEVEHLTFTIGEARGAQARET